jgi:hypothetical protein
MVGPFGKLGELGVAAFALADNAANQITIQCVGDGGLTVGVYAFTGFPAENHDASGEMITCSDLWSTTTTFTQEQVDVQIAEARADEKNIAAAAVAQLTVCTAALDAQRRARLAQGAEDLAKFNADAENDPGADGGPSIATIIIPVVMVVLLLVGGATTCFCRRTDQQGGGAGQAHLKRPAPHAVDNAAFGQAFEAPYADNEAVHAAPGIQIVQLQAPYGEAEGPPAIAAHHALLDQRRQAQPTDPAAAAAAASEGADYEMIDENIVAVEGSAYEEIDENIVLPAAPTGNRRSTAGASNRCLRPSPTGGTCTNVKVNGSNFCTSHLCEHAGCTESKRSRVLACPAHSDHEHEEAAASSSPRTSPLTPEQTYAEPPVAYVEASLYVSENSAVYGAPVVNKPNTGGPVVDGAAGSKPHIGQGIRRNSDARKGSVYEGFGAGDLDGDDLEC